MPQTIRDVRLGHGVSQTRLAFLLGISQRHLSRFELGQVSIGEERTREASPLPRSRATVMTAETAGPIVRAMLPHITSALGPSFASTASSMGVRARRAVNLP